MSGRGRIFAVVGPSGAGKDTLIEAARQARPDLHILRRVITRPAEAGGEPFEGVTEAEFAAREARGEFVLTWRAHGLRYGIPQSAEAALAQGRCVVFNGSRAMLAATAAAFSGLVVIHVTAAIPILAERLAARGRETREDIAARLARATDDFPVGCEVRQVENNATLEQAVRDFLAALQPERV